MRLVIISLILFYFKIIIYLYVYICVYVHAQGGQKRASEVGPGVTGTCDPQDMGPENQTQGLCGNSKCS